MCSRSAEKLPGAWRRTPGTPVRSGGREGDEILPSARGHPGNRKALEVGAVESTDSLVAIACLNREERVQEIDVLVASQLKRLDHELPIFNLKPICGQERDKHVGNLRARSFIEGF